MLKANHSRRSVLRGLAIAAPAIILSPHLASAMSDQEEAESIIRARVAALNSCFNGHKGFPGAYGYFVGGACVPYIMYTANGIKPQGRDYGPTAPTAVEAVNGWITTTDRLLTNSVGVLFWRRQTKLELKAAVTADPEWGREASPAGWTISSRFVITTHEPATSAEACADWPPGEDMETRAEIDASRERYLITIGRHISA